jgi:FkbH-like protein
MRRLRPEVLTPEWPDDIVSFRATLEGLCDFETVAITNEDRSRGAMYASMTQREELRKRTSSLDEYLFGLKIEVRINQADESDVDRVHQLVHKTNQFNLTTRRYSYADVQGFLRDNDTLIYVLRNQDCFGDNGLVAVAVLVLEDDESVGSTWKIDTFLMSCRVFGRSIEAGFLKQVIDDLDKKGCRYVVGEFAPTSKNALVKDFYSEAGFQSKTTNDGIDRWILDVSAYHPPELPWLEVMTNFAITTRSV